jgi:hypothetical protein
MSAANSSAGAAGTTSATTVRNAGAAADSKKEVTPDPTESLMTSDMYNMFIGIFLFVLSLFVLVTTGSILSVLVLWVTIALVLTVLVYYGILTIDQILGQEEQKAVEKVIETPIQMPRGGPLVGSEVFNISDQQFTYDEAPAVCAAYGGELATLEQIMEAYANGAEWCNYGWSAGGMALYPTQRETWEKLQGEVDTGKRTRCGRPGVNGGYFDPSLKFGVNCFGFKPLRDFTPPAPIPGTDTQKFRDMVSRFRAMIKTMTIDPYSRQVWSEGGRSGEKVTETFVGSAFGLNDIFSQNFFTPHGVKEDFEVGDPRYVEPIGSTGLGSTARAARGPYALIGDRGEPGTTGPAGPAGAAGPIGGQGAVGPQGVEGRQGPDGPKGDKGDKGEKGDQGERGAPGEGSAGGIGPKGDKGDKGEKGDKGDIGLVGPAGPGGAQGPQGTAGTPGAKGDKGDKGDSRLTDAQYNRLVPKLQGWGDRPSSAYNYPKEFGGSGGGNFSTSCPDGMVMVGLRGGAGLLVDRIGPICV